MDLSYHSRLCWTC